MKKLLGTILPLFVMTLFTITSFQAQAADMTGRLGVGGARTPLHPGGISVRYFLGNLGFQGVLNHTYSGPDSRVNGRDEASNTTLLLARALFNTALSDQANLYLAGGLGAGIKNFSEEADACSDPDLPQTGLCNRTELGLELAMGAEYFFSRFFSVSGEVGVPIRFVPEGGAVFDSLPEGTYISLFDTINWGASFSFIF